MMGMKDIIKFAILFLAAFTKVSTSINELLYFKCIRLNENTQWRTTNNSCHIIDYDPCIP